jgi:hypothetical protein
LKLLVQHASGFQASLDESLSVLHKFEASAQAATQTGFKDTMTTDPRYLSKAVFEWWWITKGNRDRFFHFAAGVSASVDPTPAAFEAPASWKQPTSPVCDVRAPNAKYLCLA